MESCNHWTPKLRLERFFDSDFYICQHCLNVVEVELKVRGKSNPKKIHPRFWHKRGISVLKINEFDPESVHPWVQDHIIYHYLDFYIGEFNQNNKIVDDNMRRIASRYVIDK